MKATTLDGISIDYQVEGSGETLLFIHGITDHKGLWAPIIAALAPHFTCARLDLRGHGASSCDKVSLAGLPLDIDAVLTQLGVETAGLVGHSVGGFAATRYAAEHPSKVSGVINIDQALNFAALATSFRPLEPALRSAQFPAVLDAIFASFGTTLLPPALQDEMRAYRGIERQETVLGLWDILFKSTNEELTDLIEKILRSIQAPYLALYGAALPTEYLAWLRGLLPTAQVESWDGLGHYLHLLEPVRTAARIQEFFLGRV